ncbi:MAG: M48 family metallopeptidase [Firmicutes bacterium]|nr:M48 family metallopeptidase [Bacillota bacterium]
MIDYILKRCRRKTLAIYVRNGQVEVRAPMGLPKAEIDKFVAVKQNWITEKLATEQERFERKKAFSLNYGSEILVRGVPYPIVPITHARPELDGKCVYIPANLDPAQIKNACITAYRHIAQSLLTARTAEYAKLMSVEPASVSISSAKGRWGSCCACKKITFSWRLIMGSDDVIDYVVVHELAHILQMNHSKEYWAIVESVLPDYKQRRARLAELQRRIAAEDWD